MDGLHERVEIKERNPAFAKLTDKSEGGPSGFEIVFSEKITLNLDGYYPFCLDCQERVEGRENSSKASGMSFRTDQTLRLLRTNKI